LENDAETVVALIAAGEDCDAKDSEGFTPLHLAAQQDSLDAARHLLQSGAEVDSTNAYGNTPLFVAVFNSQGYGEMIELLRAHGADPHHANAQGRTPLGLARLIANTDVAQFFEGVPKVSS
jgi:ankyrin repeat protein